MSDSLWFEAFRLDPLRGLFRVNEAGDEEPVALGSRALDLLRLLAERGGEVVPKDAIMQRVWPRLHVDESNLTVQISALRRVLDKDRAQGSCIQTVPGRGYRFVVPVTRSEQAAAGLPELPLPDKPSIAVMPFQNLSGDPDQEYFADGMVEEIITALSRIRWLFVIARNSTFTYKGRAVDLKQVARELGVRYVLEGSVRKGGDRVRITGQLIEAESGAHLWADRFEGSLEDVFALQDKVAISVAGVIEPTLQAAEIHRSTQRPTSDLTAYDFYLRALPHLVLAGESSQQAKALDLLGRAIDRDPEYGPALVMMAFYHFRMDVQDRRGADPEDNGRHGTEFARRALRAAPDDPVVLALVAFVLAYFGEDIGSSIALIDRAVILNPSYAQGWYWSGVLRNWAGQPEIALEHFAMYLRLSPRERLPLYLTGMGISLFFSRRFEEAAEKFRESLEHLPKHALTYRFLAASYAHMGRMGEAREVIDRLLALSPTVVDRDLRYRNREHREMYLAGLRLAMSETE